MANGYEPYCVICTSFRTEPQGSAANPVNVRSPAVRCFCARHGIKLPFDQVNRLLICSDWQHYKSSECWASASSLPSGELYAYDTIYDVKLQYFAPFDAFRLAPSEG